ncbi:MAG: DUF177 domain-containing protein [Candidatus Omnitrophica bacterium]|nr:DUF177 domain-containing protein [Candidatus Omnitrophota bacterium]
MKIYLHELKLSTPTKVAQEYNAKELDMEFVDLKYCRPLSLDGVMEKDEDTLTFRGHITSEVEHTCGRCLKVVRESIDCPFELFYDIRGKFELDTLSDLRELLILDHPISFICASDCRGLCPNCGANLNESPCACMNESRQKTFSAIQQIRMTKKKEENHGQS